MRANAPLTTERLRALLHYDPVSGVFTWREARSWMVKAGDVAGRKVTPEEHVAICIDYVTYTAGRLAWQWMMGKVPAHHIEHQNGKAGDASWSNLRLEPRPGIAIRQGSNAKGYTDRKSRRKRFRVRVWSDGGWKGVGGFETRAAARDAYWFAKALIDVAR